MFAWVIIIGTIICAYKGIPLINLPKQEVQVPKIKAFNIEITNPDLKLEANNLLERTEIYGMQYENLRKEYDRNEQELIKEQKSPIQSVEVVQALTVRSLQLLAQMNDIESKTLKCNNRLKQIALEEVTKCRQLQAEEIKYE
jgi:hypothetical protein